MRIERVPVQTAYALYIFIGQHLPPSLKAVQYTTGNGIFYCVKRKDLASYLLPFPFDMAVRVASIENDKIELLQPQYVSEFQNIIAKYEAETGKEITLRY